MKCQQVPIIFVRMERQPQEIQLLILILFLKKISRELILSSNREQKKESVHIPVVISQTGLNDLVYNDFHIGEDCDVTIVAGCGIHNSGDGLSQHDGIHEFLLERIQKSVTLRSITDRVTARAER